MGKFIRYKKLFAVFAVLTLFWMGVIFMFSAQNAEKSTSESHGVTDKIISHTDPEYKELDEHEQNVRMSQLNDKVRKLAHAFNFVVLGILVGAASLTFCTKPYRNVCFAFVLCAAYAASDELHQRFVPGRGASIRDVGIDCLGALIGTALVISAFYAIKALRGMRKVKKLR